MSNFLDNINCPGDLKSLKIEELNQLAFEIRDYLINTISNTGGHLASNLGVVELTIALHFYLNSPADKIIWDVGHQSYPHKIITGRKDKLSTIRQYGGLSGYPKHSESIHDIIETGHSSTSISSALGLALARDLKGRNDRIYSIIGDGALTGGMAFEALNNAGHLARNLNIILNDNEMSISPNVGAISHYLSELRTDPRLSKLKEDLEFLISKIPKIGPTVSKTVERVKNGLKYLIISGILFEEMGFTYLGPVNGHNIKELIDSFKNADRIDGPVLIHINTQKGKGYKPAENQPSKYHGVSPFQIKNGESLHHKSHKTYSQIFGETMVKIGKKDDKLVGITAAMPEGTGLYTFQKEFPERTFDVGIAEQHAMTMGVGLARGGMKPVVTIYSTFLQRAYDQVIHDLCIQNVPLTIAIDRAGIVGNDGETHQGMFDYSYLRPVPNMVIMAPKDENELQHMLYTAVNYPGPIALRYPRGEGQGVELDTELHEIELAKGEVLKKGDDILIIAVGASVYPSLEAAEILKNRGVNAGVINARFIKPLDKDLLIPLIKRYKKVVTVEEQALAGGFGSAILELINDNNMEDILVKRIGINDKFVPHGDTNFMRSLYEIDSQGIAKEIMEVFTLEADSWPRKNA